MPLTLAPGETTRHEARGKKLRVWVTNRRLVVEESGLGGSALTSLPLEKIDHVLYARTSRLRWLVIGAILGIVGLVTLSENSNGGGGLIAVGAVFVIIYFLSRRQRVVFATQGSEISLEAKGFGANAIESFLSAVESARQAHPQVAAAPRPAPETRGPETRGPRPSASPPRVEVAE